MPNNEKGEIIRESALETQIEPQQDMSYDGVISGLYDALVSAQSMPPEGVEVPEGLMLWLGQRLEYNKTLIEEIKQRSQEGEISSVIHPNTKEIIDLSDFINRAEQSVVFSEDVEQRKAAGEFQDVKTEEELAEIRRKIRSNFLDSSQ
ncbi:MAG: hypothetical protein K0S20_603 [Patescibacteria group bacterium]|jgi:hypothetical protein|nr:hypothetical protein [Patescibacteria group bacterium]